jgi:hypothetical protein
MTVMTFDETRQYEAGFRAGHKSGWLDAGMGSVSEYSSTSFETDPPYTRGYSDGYRKGFHARQHEAAR